LTTEIRSKALDLYNELSKPKNVKSKQSHHTFTLPCGSKITIKGDDYAEYKQISSEMNTLDAIKLLRSRQRMVSLKDAVEIIRKIRDSNK